MFFRTKTSGSRSYLQIVENRWEDGRPRQRVIATLGRLDQLQQSGQLDALLVSGARLAQSVLLLSAHAKGQLPTITTRRIGPALVFERLWREAGCQRVIEQLLDGRRFEFDVERAGFLTVLHRLFDPGSDRAADKWRAAYQIEGCESLQRHHLHRAMAWLGEELPQDQQAGKTPFAPRCTKDRIEEGLFDHRRDLFTDLQLVFFDTTSISFEGAGGQDIGQRGYSKDHRPDLYQMRLIRDSGVLQGGRSLPPAPPCHAFGCCARARRNPVLPFLSAGPQGFHGPTALFGPCSHLKTEEPETQVDRQLLLRDPTMRAEPRPQQGPEPFQGVDVDLAAPVPIIITGELPGGVTDRAMGVAPLREPVVDVVLVAGDPTSRCDHRPNQRADGPLLNILQHPDHHLAGALDHTKDRRLLFLQRSPSRCPLQASAAALSPFFATASGWPLCPATT